jgi:hypothetical protein
MRELLIMLSQIAAMWLLIGTTALHVRDRLRYLPPERVEAERIRQDYLAGIDRRWMVFQRDWHADDHARLQRLMVLAAHKRAQSEEICSRNPGSPAIQGLCHKLERDNQNINGEIQQLVDRMTSAFIESEAMRLTEGQRPMDEIAVIHNNALSSIREASSLYAQLAAGGNP